MMDVSLLLRVPPWMRTKGLCESALGRGGGSHQGVDDDELAHHRRV